MALFVVGLSIVPVATVYGFGLGLAWVRRGFQVESKEPTSCPPDLACGSAPPSLRRPRC